MPLYYFGLVLFVILAGMSSGLGADLVVHGSDWRYRLGTNDASSPIEYWQSGSFDDSEWGLGTTPIGYGETVAKNIGSSLSGGWLSLYMRQTFVLTNSGDVSELNFEATADDSFIVWVNGHEIGRFNIPEAAPQGELACNAPEQYTFSAIEPTVSTFTITNDLATFLTPGVNVLAAHVFNANWTSSDLYFDASLTASIDDTHPVVSSVIPTAGSQVRQLTQIEVQFSKSVAGVDAADLLINGVGATALSVIAPWQYVFEFPQPATGLVNVAWSPDHGIHDLTTASNVLPDGQWTYTLDPNTPLPQIILSEFMADNKKTLNDGDGDSSDWIELYNAETTAVDLTNWRLSVQSDNPEQWKFPKVTLAANKYLLVYASGKNRTNVAAPLHTNFKLPKEGGYLALLDATGGVVSEFPSYPPQFQDVSYGRIQGMPTSVAGYFATPTPGAANAVGGAGFAPEVNISRRSGTFTAPFFLGLSTAATNAAIRYVFGTNMPTEGSPLYSAPLTINRTTVVRARAFEPGLLPGPLVTASFIQLAADVVKFTSDLPIVVLHNLGRGDVPASTDQYVSIQVFEPVTGPSSLTNRPSLATQGIFHKRGSSTLGIAKASFFVETQDEYGNDKNVSFAGLPEESDWVLYAPNNFEPVLIHNPMAHELSRQAGRYSPRTRFVEVYLKDDSGGTPGTLSNADYNGIYVLEEKIKIGANRVDIDKLEPEHTTVPKVTGGYLMSVDRSAAGTSPFSAGNASINYLDPDYFDMQMPQRASQAQYIKNYINNFYTVLNGANWKDPLNGYAAYIDVPAWVDHHILNVVTFNVDALRLSGYFFKPRNGRLSMGPLWDFDRTQGSTDGRDFNPRLWRSTEGDRGTDMFNADGIFQNPWYGRLVRDIDFWQKWIDRYQELRGNILADTNVNAMIDNLSGQLSKAQPRERARWGTLTAPRSGNWSAGGYSHNFPGTYQGEVNFMKLWYSNRLDFIETNFVRRPRISEAGGKVALEGPTGVPIYYTIDGSDPRVAGGGIAPGANLYSEAMTFDGNARVVARAYDANHRNMTGVNNPPLSSSWSGPVSLLHLVSVPALVVTEIMYHPAPEPVSTNDADLYEYIELLNRGTNTLNLEGFRFTQGIDFVFPSLDLAAGQRVLVVRDRAAFESRYGTGANVLIAGTFTNQLSNAGERLALVGRLGEPILDFTYNNNWYPVTDGLGFSLVVADEQAPSGGWSNRLNWRASSAPQGSPGAVDGIPPAIPRVLINEILANTDPPQCDTVELYNPGVTPVDIGGWFLTDERDKPQKMRIPLGTLVPPNGYVTFDEFSFTNLGRDSFRFSSEGDSVYLFSGGTQTNLTGYAHGFTFGASASETSFGRHVTSQGRELFVTQSELTLGTTNAGPQVGPVVINEIMPEPLPVYLNNNNTRDEYVELRNITLQPVPLYDPQIVTHTWHLRGAVDYTFPMNLVLPPQGFLLLVSFDPNLDSDEVTAFRRAYSLDSNTVVLGPWSGKLNNSGDSVRLLRPDAPEVSGGLIPAEVPYLLVDEIDYSVTAPWPTNVTASNNSLQRIAGAAFGNDPANWRGDVATPGAPNIGAIADSDGDGLPDEWEITCFGSLTRDGQADFDGDGLTDVQEYLAGTSPADALDCLKIEMASYQEGRCVVRFHGLAGRTYTVEYRDAFPLGQWQKLADVSNLVADGMISVTNSISGNDGTRYYQLLTPATP